MRKAVVDWLWHSSPHPDGLVFDVGTFSIKDKVDIAATWLLPPTAKAPAPKIKSTVIICCPTREACWPERSSAEEIVQQIAELRQQREILEEQIRHDEPDLRDKDILFEEFAVWNYQKSTNPKYQELQNRIASLEKILYKGSRIEHISNNSVADNAYIAVPTGILIPRELREDWGLLWISEQDVIVARKPKKLHVHDNARFVFLKRLLNKNTAKKKKNLDMAFKRLSTKVQQ